MRLPFAWAIRLPWVSRRHHEWVITRAANRNAELREQVEVLVAAAEFDRQQRLAALPTLLAAEAKAALAEERLATVLTRPAQFPEIWPSVHRRWAAVAAEYHQSTDGQRP